MKHLRRIFGIASLAFLIHCGPPEQIQDATWIDSSEVLATLKLPQELTALSSCNYVWDEDLDMDVFDTLDVVLTWDEVETAATHFVIEKLEGQAFVAIGEVEIGTNIHNFHDVNVAMNQTHTYRLRAEIKNAAGNVDYISSENIGTQIDIGDKATCQTMTFDQYQNPIY